MKSLIRFGFLLLLMATWLIMSLCWLNSLWDVISTTSAQARTNLWITTIGLMVTHFVLSSLVLRVMKKPTGPDRKSEPPVRLDPHF